MPITIHNYCLLYLKTKYILLDSIIVGVLLSVLKFVKLFVMFCYNIVYISFHKYYAQLPHLKLLCNTLLYNL